ncbi:MAG TPA: hypothetical protein VFI13_12415, partial [Gemmatimonadales bacterium]|nr:hypothetical protein [Gemmatimonadales bacterium]
YRCPLFSTPSKHRAEGRYQQMVRILRDWLPADWSAAEPPGQGYILRQFVAEDGRVGSRITLALTDSRTIFFIFQPYTD